MGFLQLSRLCFFTILLISLPCKAQNQNPFTFSEKNFNETHYKFFKTRGDGSIVKSALQLTPDSINAGPKLFNRSGRVMFTRRFKLWEEKGTVASFNSTFDINAFPTPPTNIPGEGLAFVIAPDIETHPLNSYGEWLGLTNATLDGSASNKFVAIELDTVKQAYDPDDNHMGLNINSVRSNKTVSLSDFGINIGPVNATIWTVWVEYNGSSKIITAYMNKRGESKPRKPVMREVVNLRHYVNQYSYMGFTGSTGTTAELNCILSWDLRVEILPEKKDWTWLKFLLGVGVPGLVILISGLIWLVHYFRKLKGVEDPIILGALKKLPGMPKEFTFKELKQATNNFDDKMKLGQGGFGVVYKGILVEEKVEVAVKKFSRESIKGADDFLSELTIINRLRHKHLVRLIGWCHKTGTLLLVYEYMPNGSVDDHLFSGPNKFLNWTHRYNIITGLASALQYLHNDYDVTVLHRDLKSSNILLDADYNARLGDFGLARTIDHGRTSYAELSCGGIQGTIGYIAPESFHEGKATKESDVYSFGVVALEVVCGQRPWTKFMESLILIDWVWKLHGEGRILEAVDERLGHDYVDNEAERLLLLGLACCHPIAGERPTMSTVVQILSGSVPTPKLPHFRPAFVWPAMASTGLSNMSHLANSGPITSSYYSAVGVTK